MQTSSRPARCGARTATPRRLYDVPLDAVRDGGLSDPAYELADHVEHRGGRGVYDAAALVAAVELDPEDQAAHFMALVGHD